MVGRLVGWFVHEDTTVAVVVDGALRLALALNDTLRPSAPRLVAELQARHVEAALLTGDGEAAGRHAPRQRLGRQREKDVNKMLIGLKGIQNAFKMHWKCIGKA